MAATAKNPSIEQLLRIREQRKACGLTLKQLADKVGTTPQTIQRLETANMSVTIEWLSKIANALNLKVSDLIAGTYEVNEVQNHFFSAVRTFYASRLCEPPDPHDWAGLEIIQSAVQLAKLAQAIREKRIDIHAVRNEAAMKLKVPYLKWRDGRPRWEPGPTMRKAGWKGRDLRDEAGQYLGLQEAMRATIEFNNELRKWREAGGQRVRRPITGAKLLCFLLNSVKSRLPQSKGLISIAGGRSSIPFADIRWPMACSPWCTPC